MTMTGNQTIRKHVAELAPWFHNLHLPDGEGGAIQTHPDSPFGDFPRNKWEQIAPHLPVDLRGKRCLDVGCNAGFYTIELARRGAQVTAIDLDEHYLEQARFAVDVCGMAERVDFQTIQVYDLARRDWTFDVVLFMGVFYHLRYPLLGLDAVRGTLADDGVMVFQTLTMPGPKREAETTDVGFEDRDRLKGEAWPKIAFFEHGFSGDPTNWWAPSHTCCEALLRSTGLRVTQRPGEETFLAVPDPQAYTGVPQLRRAEYEAALGLRR